MVFQEESFASRWWPLSLGRWSPREEKSEGASESQFPLAASEERDALAWADCMEKGLVHECADEFLRPVEQSSSGKLSRFYIERSADRLQYRLFRDGGEFCMFAEVRVSNRDVSFFLYDPDDRENNLYDPERPAFTMSFDEKTKSEWLLSHYTESHYSPRHQASHSNYSNGQKRETQEAAFMQHSRLEVGHGVNHVLEANIASTSSSGGMSYKQDSSEEERTVHRLITRSAVWNEELQTLVLDFRGRSVIPSAKNFQLATEDKPGRVVCQHGKIGKNTFSLDFRAPLSISQAFALSITTLFWE